MNGSVRKKLHDLGRAIIGAMMLGMPLLYTMETWWLGWRLPAWLLLAWAILGLVVISVVVHFVGFRKNVDERKQPWWMEVTDFFELLATSFIAGLIVLYMFGIAEWGDDLGQVVRLGLVEVVPLGLGAAITNRALAGAENADGATKFGHEMGIFALGALFFAFNVAPTEEMELMAAHAGPLRLVIVIFASLLLAYLALYELQFRGSAGRVSGAESKWLQVGETVTGYAISVLVSAALLWAYGHFQDTITPMEMAQKTVVLAFIGSLGGAAARVVM